MIVLVAISLLFLLTMGIAVFSWWRSDFASYLYAYGGGVLVIWTLVFVSHPERAHRQEIIPWGISDAFHVQPTLLIDEQVWMIALALVAIAFTYVMAYQGPARGLSWALSFVTAGLIGVFSENGLTLLFSWTLVDLLLMGYLFRNRDLALGRDRFELTFTSRLLGPMLLVYTNFLSGNEATPLSFQVFSSRVGMYLFVAAVLRFGLTIPKILLPARTKSDRSLTVVVDSASAAISMSLLTRIAGMGLAPPVMSSLRVLIAVVFLLCGIWWIMANDPASGRRAWMTGWLSLIILGVIYQRSEISLTWGLTMLLPGNMFFLVHVKPRLKRWIAALFLIGLSGLPFTPSWEGTHIFSEGLWGLMWGVCYGLILFGGLRFILWHEREGASQDSSSISEVLGLVLLTLTHLILSLYRGLIPDSWGFWLGRWGFLTPYLVALPFLLWRGKLIGLFGWVPDVRDWVDRRSDLVSNMIAGTGKIVSGMVMGIFRLLEGRGGLIWALLGVFFLLSLLASTGGG